MGKLERKRPLGRRCRRIWEDNIRMDLKESRWESVDLIDLVPIGIIGGILSTRQEYLGCHTKRGIS
jgi:hypothetical protein